MLHSFIHSVLQPSALARKHVQSVTTAALCGHDGGVSTSLLAPLSPDREGGIGEGVREGRDRP